MSYYYYFFYIYTFILFLFYYMIRNFTKLLRYMLSVIVVYFLSLDFTGVFELDRSLRLFVGLLLLYVDFFRLLPKFVSVCISLLVVFLFFSIFYALFCYYSSLASLIFAYTKLIASLLSSCLRQN